MGLADTCSESPDNAGVCMLSSADHMRTVFSMLYKAATLMQSLQQCASGRDAPGHTALMRLRDMRHWSTKPKC